MQRARAAQTRGELNALTRDLDVGGPVAHTPPASIPPPNTQTYGQAPLSPPVMSRPPQAATPPKRSLRTSLLIGGLVLLVTCGGGLVSCVSAIVDAVSESTSVSGTDDLLSDGGWSTMVADVDDSVGVRSVVDVAVRTDAATVGLPDGDDSVLHYYYDGGDDVEATENTVRDPARALFDLALVEGSIVEDAVEQARRRAGIREAAEAIVYVSATAKDRPTLMVSFPDEPGDYVLVVDLDGTIVSESGVN